MYDNVYTPVTSLPRAPHYTSGICAIKYFKWEDVLVWPELNPLTGTITTSLQLKPGKSIYLASGLTDSTRRYEEAQKPDGAGDFFEMSCKGSLAGSSGQNFLTLAQMKHHQWGLIIEDRNGFNRLIGNKDSGASFSHNYGNGDARKTDVQWKWESPMPAPIYGGASFDITIGGITVTAGSLTLIMRFRVGAAGSPMNEGSTLLVNAGFVNKHLLVMADGIGLPVDDFSGAIDWTGSIQRHVEKAFASNTIDFKGSVVHNEIIEVYAFS